MCLLSKYVGFEFKRDESGDKHETICLEMIVENVIYIRLPGKKLAPQLMTIDKDRYLSNTKNNSDEKMSQRNDSQRYEEKQKS